MEFSEVVALLRRRRVLAVAVFAITIALNFAVLGSRPRRWRAEAILQVPAQTAGTVDFEAIVGVRVYEPFNATVFVELLDDPRFAQRARALLAAGDPERAARWRRDAFEVDVEGGDPLGFVRVSYTASVPGDAAPCLDASADAIRELSQEHFERSVERGRDLFQHSVDEAELELAAVDEQLLALRKEAGLPPGGDGARGVRQGLEAMIRKLEMRAVELEGDVVEARGSLTGHGESEIDPEDPISLLALVEGTPLHSFLSELAEKLIRAELHLQRVAMDVAPKHKIYRDAVADRDHYRAEFDKLLAGESIFSPYVKKAIAARAGRGSREGRLAAARLLSAESRARATSALIREKREALDRLAAREADLLRLERKRRGLEASLETYRATLTGLDEASHLAPEVVREFRASSGEDDAGRPAERYLPIVFVLGTVLTMAAVYTVEFFDHRIHDQHVLRRRSHVPGLGIVPHLSDATLTGRPGAALGAGEVFSSVLKKTLVRLQSGRVLLVTGAEPGAGKSLVAARLALASARLGSRTLLVDADLRAPRLHESFGVPAAPGLAEALCGEDDARRRALEEQLERAANGGRLRLPPAELERVVAADDPVVLLPGGALCGVLHGTLDPQLSLLPAGLGGREPGPLLSSERMDALLDEAKREFDFVVVDAPPLIAVADALLLANRVDGCLLVVRAGRTTSPDLYCARQNLEDVGAHIVGQLLNDVPVRASGYYAYEAGERRYRVRS